MANYLCIAIILLAQILHATSSDYSTVVRSNAQNTFASPRKKTDGSAAPVRRSNEPFPTNNEPPRRTNNEPPRRRIQQPTSSLKKRYPQIIRSRSVYHKRPTSSAIRRPSSSSSNRVPINRQYRPSPPIRSRRPPPRGALRLLSRAQGLRGASRDFYQRKSLKLGKSTGKHRAANRPRVASRVPGKSLSRQKHYFPRGRAPPPNAAWTGAGPGAATPKNVG